MAKGNRAKTLAEQLADLDGPAPKGPTIRDLLWKKTVC